MHTSDRKETWFDSRCALSVWCWVDSEAGVRYQATQKDPGVNVVDKQRPGCHKPWHSMVVGVGVSKRCSIYELPNLGVYIYGQKKHTYILLRGLLTVLCILWILNNPKIFLPLPLAPNSPFTYLACRYATTLAYRHTCAIMNTVSGTEKVCFKENIANDCVLRISYFVIQIYTCT